LFLALLNPHIKLQQKLNSYLLVADVTQSMNAEDLKIDGHSVSRLDFTKNLMRKIIDSSPCGTYFSLGIFSSDNIALLLNPVEVCRSYDVLSDAIDHIDWRMAWKGNSRLSYAIHSAENMFKFLPIPSKMIFFTDGEEAPKLNATIKSDLSNVTFGKSVVFVGIGGKKKVPIPRFNATNEMIGYWPITENNSARSGTSTFATALTVKPEPNQNPTVAAAEYDRYLSQLDEDYLKALSIEIGGLYLKGEDSANFYAYIKNQKIQSRIKTDFSFRSVFLALALLFILSTYFLKYWSRAIGMVLSFKYFKYKK
jgi:mxaL protein